MTTQITANNITNNTITVTQLVPGALSPKIRTISICDSSFNVLDDTAANTTGGFIQITGSTFGANSQVIIGTNNATSVTFVNTSTLRAQVPAAAAASYPVYVIDGDTGATAIKINGLTHSSFPAWSTGATLSNQTANTSFAVNLSATSDSNITYANTSALPAGTTLAANGYFSGTVTIGAQTTYSFNVRATDAENQDATRTFSLTVTLVVLEGNLFSWGRNTSIRAGVLGLNDAISKSSPVQVGAGTNWSKVASGDGSLCSGAIKTDGTMWTWGTAQYGQLGLNDRVYRSSPVQLGSLTTWRDIEGGGWLMAAIQTNGTLWVWGRNNEGQLGQNNIIDRSSPVQVGTGTDWSKVSIGNVSGIAAIKTDGTLWTWGNSINGVLGTNTDVKRSSPVQVGAGTNWLTAKRGYGHVAAIKTDGTLWAWGWNNNGQLGQNDRVDRSSPVQIGAGTTWSNVDIHNFAGMVTKTDGTLWTWGSCTDGQLGINIRVAYRSSPVQVGTDTNWSNKISMGNKSVGAIKTNGTLWVWGNGDFTSQQGQPFSGGALGLNDEIARSSPVQVGAGTTWLELNTGYRALAIRRYP
jgi:alpha-tubulin suppressor-like RCC1 family protein